MSSWSGYAEEDVGSDRSEEDPIRSAPHKLEKQALRGVLEGLHELTSSKACSFAGSGSVEPADPVRVTVSALSGEPQPFGVTFPGTQDLSPLMKACSSASFGKGPLQVYDAKYRSALELSPLEFTTSFSLAEFDILPEIARLTNTDGASLTAKLYKLNLYRPGDFFKNHLDTPRAGLIGSLMVCLPHEHTGGALKVRHLNTEVTYDWGKSDAVQWAFFYSDCEHEVQEVTSGCRITLAYNLFSTAASPQPALKHELSPLGVQLRKALDSAAFLPNGGKLGFALSHLYGHTSKHFDASHLKGSDAAILETARQLGLEAQVTPVWKTDPWMDELDEELAEELHERDRSKPDALLPQGCEKQGRVKGNHPIGGPLRLKVSHDCTGDEDMFDPHRGLGIPAKDLSYSCCIHWVNGNFEFQEARVSLAYGNEWSITTKYSAAAIIIKIKSFDKRFS